jgi:hypothetical protein
MILPNGLSMKGIAPLLIFAVIALLGIVAAVVAVPGLGGSLAAIVSPIKSCDNAPGDYRCFCGLDQEKLGSASSFRCAEPPTSLNVDFPITTWGEARAYAISKGFTKCVPSDAYLPDIPLNTSITGFVTIDCLRQTSPFGGAVIWSTNFVADTGSVITSDCDEDTLTNCPPETPIGPLEPVPFIIEPYYACNTGEFDAYVKSMNGTSAAQIIARLKESCESHLGTPISNNPQLANETRASVIAINKVTPCGANNQNTCSTNILDYTQIVCAIRLEGFSYPTSLGAWGVRVHPDGTVETAGKKCANPAYCNPNDPEYTTFQMAEVGICFPLV